MKVIGESWEWSRAVRRGEVLGSHYKRSANRQPRFAVFYALNLLMKQPHCHPPRAITIHLVHNRLNQALKHFMLLLRRGGIDKIGKRRQPRRGFCGRNSLAVQVIQLVN